jgi:pyruvate formate lyase activating enzyme
MKREALLTEIRDSQKVRCGLCQRRCEIAPGKTGWCRTRINDGGILYSSIYGEVSSLSFNPIEKKPVYHFFPGSRWVSLGSVGCNFRCPGCQNWEIAHWQKGPKPTRYVSPEDLLARAKSSSSIGISWTFNEPVLWFEYTLEAARQAKVTGLFTNYVTNGTITPEGLKMIAPFLDVYRVDVKGFSEKAYGAIAGIQSFQGILEVTEQAKKYGLHVEVVTNVIPGLNSQESELRGIAGWIRDRLGPDTPWHVTRFHPYHRLRHLSPTPVSDLEKGWSIGKEEGLWYVYLGNVPGHKYENTYCHGCGELLVERYIFDVVRNRIEKGRCPHCRTVIPGRFDPPGPAAHLC